MILAWASPFNYGHCLMPFIHVDIYIKYRYLFVLFPICRVYIFYDAHLLDTFFDGGGDMNFGLIAASVVAKWTWSSSFSWSSSLVSVVSLTLSTLNYIFINHGDQRVRFKIIINILVIYFWFI